MQAFNDNYYGDLGHDYVSICEEDGSMATAKSKSDISAMVTIVVAIVVPIVAATWYLGIRFSDLDKHISKIETAVRIVGAKQGGDTQTLVDEALKVAANDSSANRPADAQKVLAIANRLLEQQKQESTPQPQEVFTSTAAHYRKLERRPYLKDAVHQGLITLAEYRSDTITLPQGVGAVMVLGQITRNSIMDSVLIGGTGGGLPIRNDPQGLALDGFTLTNVIFKNMTIVYHGGPVLMHNVRFVGCRFIVPQSPRGSDLLEAVISQPVSASLG